MRLSEASILAIIDLTGDGMYHHGRQPQHEGPQIIACLNINIWKTERPKSNETLSMRNIEQPFRSSLHHDSSDIARVPFQCSNTMITAFSIGLEKLFITLLKQLAEHVPERGGAFSFVSTSAVIILTCYVC